MNADTEEAPPPLAGWYPDPEQVGVDRWWDGATWTTERRWPPAPPRNTLAVVGLILSLAGIIVPIVLVSLAGGIVSAVALARSKRMAKDGVLVTGRGPALAGVLVGFIWGGLCLVGIIAVVALVVWVASVGQNFQFPDSPVA